MDITTIGNHAIVNSKWLMTVRQLSYKYSVKLFMMEGMGFVNIILNIANNGYD